jgi:hypothetical protein
LTEAVEEFLAEAGEFLHVERARNTVLLTVTETLRAKAATGNGAGTAGAGTAGAGTAADSVVPCFGWWRAAATGPVRGAFLHTPPFPVLLSAMPAEAVAELAAHRQNCAAAATRAR